MIAAAVLAAQVNPPLAMAAPRRRTSPNATIRHAVIGCRIRGRVHAREFGRQSGVEIAYVCDPDSKLRAELAEAVHKQTGRRPRAVADMRTVFDDNTVDTVSIAAPNHWHALAAIWAMQSGKDVYVEKPVSHNVVEGRRTVQVARKLGRICQGGTQNRSRGDLAAAAKYIREGKLGEVSLARTIVYGNRSSIGVKKKPAPQKSVDLDLWLGPASKEITRQNLHYDWHWVWDTGNGELGNNNIHYVDICRWLVGLRGLGQSVFSIGGRFGYEDAGETPNTQIVVHQFGGGGTGEAVGTASGKEVTVIQEVRGLKSDPFSKNFKAGHVIHGTEGFIAEGSLFDLDGRMVRRFEGPSVNHFENFIAAVREQDETLLRADIHEGHQSTALCHIGNISHRLADAVSLQEATERLRSLRLGREVHRSVRKMQAHLAGHGVGLGTPIALGPLLRIVDHKESFVQNDAANQLLGRDYRHPFVLPAESSV